MDRDGQHIPVIIKNMFRAVTMMHIPVNNRDTLALPAVWAGVPLLRYYLTDRTRSDNQVVNDGRGGRDSA